MTKYEVTEEIVEEKNVLKTYPGIKTIQTHFLS